MLTWKDVDDGYFGSRVDPDFRLCLMEFSEPKIYAILSNKNRKRVNDGTAERLAMIRAAWNSHDIGFVMANVPSHVAMIFVRMNFKALCAAGLLEPALVSAWTRANLIITPTLPREFMRELFYQANRERLRELGDPLPSMEFLTIYRGVPDTSERGSRLGMGWTLHPGIAAWFAVEAHSFHKKSMKPGVFRLKVRSDDQRILFFFDDRGEKEVVFLPQHGIRPHLVRPMPTPIHPKVVAPHPTS